MGGQCWKDEVIQIIAEYTVNIQNIPFTRNGGKYGLSFKSHERTEGLKINGKGGPPPLLEVSTVRHCGGCNEFRLFT